MDNKNVDDNKRIAPFFCRKRITEKRCQEPAVNAIKIRVKSTYLILLISIFLFACSEKSVDKNYYPKTEIIESSISEQTSVENIKSQPCYFINDSAKKKCDSTLIQLFDTHKFNRNIKWNEEHSFINCDVKESVELVEFGDTMCCNPRFYNLTYDVQIGDKSIYQFRMTAGADEVFEPVSSVVVEQLAAYKKLLNGEFKIDYNRAERIANDKGYVGKNMTIELFYDNKGDLNSNTSFYWAVDAHKTDDTREILRIDPNNGKVETTSIVITSIVCT
jgi:hypothetical protein